MSCSQVWGWLGLVWAWQLPVVEAQAALSQLMQQLHRPSAWPGYGWHSLDLKLWVLWGRKTPSQEWAGVKGAACPARGSVGWCVPLQNCYTKEGAVLDLTVSSEIVNCLVQPEV